MRLGISRILGERCFVVLASGGAISLLELSSAKVVAQRLPVRTQAQSALVELNRTVVVFLAIAQLTEIGVGFGSVAIAGDGGFVSGDRFFEAIEFDEDFAAQLVGDGATGTLAQIAIARSQGFPPLSGLKLLLCLLQCRI